MIEGGIFCFMNPVFGMYDQVQHKPASHLCLWEGILFSRCPNDRPTDCPTVCP